MEVKIGVQHAPRELVLESTETSEEVAASVDEAVRANEGTFNLVDDRGRRIIVPVDKLAYVEIGEQTTRGVGFTASS